jgi:hypothetical protein|tara:strand:+ start:1203 stop:2057 length:855 start_codon:yes stop_codon:yes gene_type:complete
MSFTYTQLKTAIKDYTENTEVSFVSHLSDFVKATEQRIFTTVDLEVFRKNATGALSSGNQFLGMPTDFLAAFSVSITNNSSKEFLLQKDVNYLQESYPDSSVTGVPKYYAVYDYQNFILAPTPNAAFSSELHYYYRPASLTESKFELTVSSVSGTFQANETITGGTSGATTTISSITSATVLDIIIPSTDFTVGETITGSTSGATGTVVSTSADTTLTYLSENAPNTMLYGCLVEAYTFMKGEKDMMDLYNGRFIESLGRVKDLAEARENADAYRQGLPSRART